MSHWFVTFPLSKGAVMTVTVLGVIHSDLGPFWQALIIATVSSIIGAFGVIIAAILATRRAERVARRNEATLGRVEKALTGGAER